MTCHCIHPDNINITAANRNTPTLCSENQTSWGTVDTKLDMAAPAPIPTSNAGKVQHIKVPLLVNDASLVRWKPFISLRNGAAFILEARFPRLFSSFGFHICFDMRNRMFTHFNVSHVITGIYTRLLQRWNMPHATCHMPRLTYGKFQHYR